MEEKKDTTQALIESIGLEKAVVDAAVESSRGDEEAAASLQVRHMNLAAIRPSRVQDQDIAHNT